MAMSRMVDNQIVVYALLLICLSCLDPSNGKGLIQNNSLPSLSPTACYDVTGWVDSQGDDCNWYDQTTTNVDPSHQQEQSFCELYGLEFKSRGHTAITACCVCGGGYVSAVQPSAFPTGLPTFQPTEVRDCVDDASFRDEFGFTCKDYDRDLDDDFEFVNGGTRCDLIGKETGAVEMCCACGGGYYEPYVPSTSPSSSIVPSDVKPSTLPTQETCIDYADWEDLFGDDCNSYDGSVNNVTRCEQYGNTGFNHGLTSKSACCICGGGLKVENTIIAKLDNPQPRPLKPSIEALGTIGEPCINVPGWIYGTVDGINITCDNFGFKASMENSTTTCDLYGHVLGSFGLSAFEACCICGGGYNGTLIGKSFRVSFPDDSDSFYPSFTRPRPNTGDNNGFSVKDGSIVSFLRGVAETTGFGMYGTPISPDMLSSSHNSTYDACINGLVSSETDICIGHFWNVDDTVLESEKLFSDQFYLIVPKVHATFWDRMVTPFLPFTIVAWLALLLTSLYMAMVFNIIQKGGICISGKGGFCRFGSSIYYCLQSFTSGSVENDVEKMAERVVAVGFSVFGLVILTAYTATTAAFLVTGISGFQSLDDVIKAEASICITNRIYEIALMSIPEAMPFILEKNYNTSTLLNAIGSGECDTVILPIDSYDYAVTVDNNLCEGLNFLRDKVIMNADVVVAINPRLGTWGDMLLESINEWITNGLYDQWHVYYQSQGNNNYSKDKSKRLLKGAVSGGAIAASSSSSKQGIIRRDICGEVEEINLETAQLTLNHLIFPIFFSFVCTTVGLVLFYCNRKRTIPLKEKIGRAAGKSLLSEEEEEYLLLHNLHGQDPLDLYRELQSFGVEAKYLKEALNELPDKSKLVEILFDKKCKVATHEFKKICELDTFELCQFLDWFENIYENARENTEVKRGLSAAVATAATDAVRAATDLIKPNIGLLALNNSEDPKKDLVRHIMMDKNMRRTALQCVNEKRFQRIEEFEILSYLNNMKRRYSAFDDLSEIEDYEDNLPSLGESCDRNDSMTSAEQANTYTLKLI